MEPLTVRKTFKYKLHPTAEQEGTMAFVLRRCCELYNAGLQERRDAWQMRGVSITAASQSAQLPAIKAVRPEYCDIHSQGVARGADSSGACVSSVLPAYAAW